jgi:micrococcal nuclease
MYTYQITPIKIIDGDTIDAEIDLGFDVKIKKRIRFMGINTPESRTRDLEEKARGLAAKDRVKQLLEGCKNITLKSHGVGKFGRCLGEIHIDMVDGQDKLTLVSLNELLISEGHAVEYFGGKRK